MGAPDDIAARLARTTALWEKTTDDRLNVHHARTPVRAELLDADGFPATEAGDAEFFAEQVKGKFLFDHAQRRWFVFAGHSWRLDVTGEVTQAAIATMRQRASIALQMPAGKVRDDRLTWAIRGEAQNRLEHLLHLAATNPTLCTDGTEWDRDPFLLGVANGVVSLRDGTLRTGRPEDLIMRVAPIVFNAEASAPRWERFILEIADERAELAAFHQRLLGYCLTGCTTEQCFCIWHGHGSNGKSTALETITRYVIPQHSWTMDFPTSAWSEAISEYQRAELVGRRLVVAKESEERKPLHTEFIKSLTGSETVNARHVYGRPFQFLPQAKFVLSCNHRPTIKDQSYGMWRRVRLVPFNRRFTIDQRLPDALAAEAPGILTWMVQGALAWQRDGLTPPAAVNHATATYQTENDPVAAFLDAQCVIADHAQVRAGVLLGAYQAWCASERMPQVDILSSRTFGETMKARFHAIPGRNVTYQGVGLLTDEAAL